MQEQITINNVIYTFKEQFDVNLTLDYENDTWEEWHILREFISNALDSVSSDTNKIQLQIKNEYIHIRDHGEGYPLVYAKRIGATSKKNEIGSIGQFGEGVKLSLLTCIRKNIKVSIASMNWLILPKTVEIEGQQVLLYDIYETEEQITGTLVIIEATEKTIGIIENIDSYFLHFKEQDCLFGDINEGIYSKSKGIANLYNKGVYVKAIEALYSYGISIEKLNRDRDFISHSDTAYKISDVWEKVDQIELAKTLIQASITSSEIKNKYIEFYSGFYTHYPEIWSKAFEELYGRNAVLFTNDIASREAESLGYRVIHSNYILMSVLKKAGVKEDTAGLSSDYEFTFPEKLNSDENLVLNKLFGYAKILDIDLPQEIKVFEEYSNHEDIPGLYQTETKQLYLKRKILNGDLENVIKIFLHEANHHKTNADDISREFSESLCELLSKLLLKYESKVGIENEIEIVPKGIILPSEIRLSADSLNASIAVIKDELIINLANNIIKISLPKRLDKIGVCIRKVGIYKNNFVISLPDNILDVLSGYSKIKCHIQ